MKALILLLLVTLNISAQTPKHPAEARPFTPQFICATPWKFDHPDVKNVPLKLRIDGTCESRHWKGLWTQTSAREITLAIAGGKRSVLRLSEDGKTYTGTHFDGSPVVGKRSGDVPPIARF